MDYQLGDTIEIRINTNGAILGQYFDVEGDIDVVVSLFADAAQEAAYEKGRGEKPCRICVRHCDSFKMWHGGILGQSAEYVQFLKAWAKFYPDSFQAWRGGIISQSAHGWRRSGDLVAVRCDDAAKSQQLAHDISDAGEAAVKQYLVERGIA